MATVIVGNGGLAGVVAGYLRDSQLGEAGDLLGYVGPNPSDLPTLADLDYLGPMETYGFAADTRALVAVGDPAVRRRLVETLAAAGVQTQTLVHPRAYVADRATIGDGCIISPFAFVEAGAVLGAAVVLTPSAAVGHDAVIGDFCQFSPFSGVMGACRIGDGVFLGAGALVAPRVRVGARSKLSAGAIVMSDCEAGSLMVGNPAKGRVMFRSNP